ncbi:MAG: ABC transporter substrate-binding protein [Rhodospirillales bacterium]
MVNTRFHSINRRDLLAAGAGLVGLGLTGGVRAASPGSAATLRLAMAVQPVSDPHAAGWLPASILAGQVLDRLCTLDHDNRLRPGLAKSWEVDGSLRQWTFHLDPAARWHDGSPVSADAIIWNIRRMLAPGTGSSMRGLLAPLLIDDDGKELWATDALEAATPQTLMLRLKSPRMDLPYLFDHYAALMMNPADGGRFGVGASGSGAYRLVDFEARRLAVLEAVPGRGARIQRVEVVDLGDEPLASLAALRSHQVDGVLQADPEQHDILAADPDLTLYEADTTATAFLQMKVNQAPFNDARVRRALRLACDSEAVLKLAQRGRGRLAEHHAVSPLHPSYAALPAGGYDPDGAARLLSEAGYPSGIDLTVTCKPDPAWEKAAVQVIQAGWKRAGIRAAIQVVPSGLFWDNWADYPLAFVEWAHRPLATQLLSLTLRSGVDWNATGFADAEFDALLSEAETLADPEKRRAVMKKIEALLQERGPLVQPIWRSVMTAWNRRVSGFRMHPQYWIDLKQLSLTT